MALCILVLAARLFSSWVSLRAATRLETAVCQVMDIIIIYKGSDGSKQAEHDQLPL